MDHPNPVNELAHGYQDGPRAPGPVEVVELGLKMSRRFGRLYFH
jgi:hypothetical protein